MEVGLAELTALIRTNLTRMQSLLDSHEAAIFKIDPPGLDKRVDRIEQREVVRRWSLRVSVGAALTALGTAFANYWDS